MFTNLFQRIQITDHSDDFVTTLKHGSRYTVFGDGVRPRRTLVHGCPFLITVDTADRVVVKRNVSLLIEDGYIVSVVPKDHYRREAFPRVDVLYDAEQRGGLVIMAL
jgi:hypothetical protein